MNIKKILVPVDLSDSSAAGIKYALFLAKGQGAEVMVVHVVDAKKVPHSPAASRDARLFFEIERIPVGALGDYFVEAAVERGRWELSSFLSRHVPAKTLGTVQLKKVVRLGDAAEEIIDVAALEDCDLIVMASGGKSRLARLIRGSLTEKVVRLASCPVLTIQPFARVRQDGERVPVGLLATHESSA